MDTHRDQDRVTERTGQRKLTGTGILTQTGTLTRIGTWTRTQVRTGHGQIHGQRHGLKGNTYLDRVMDMDTDRDMGWDIDRDAERDRDTDRESDEVNKIITIPMSHKNTANYCTKIYCGNLPTAEFFLHTEHRLKSTKYFYRKNLFAACQSGKTFAARQLRQKV
jgi:hypothetical protein